MDGIVDDVSKNSTTVTCDDGSPCKLHFESDIYWDIRFEVQNIFFSIIKFYFFRFSLYDKFVNPDNTITFSPSFYDCECTHGNDKNDFNDCMKALRTEMLNEYKKQIQDSKFNCYSYESNCDSS